MTLDDNEMFHRLGKFLLPDLILSESREDRMFLIYKELKGLSPEDQQVYQGALAATLLAFIDQMIDAHSPADAEAIRDQLRVQRLATQFEEGSDTP